MMFQSPFDVYIISAAQSGLQHNYMLLLIFPVTAAVTSEDYLCQ